MSEIDALLLVSFGGPEGPDDVMPFLENVTRGRGIPRERLDEVAAHYRHFGGVSPINAANRALIAALESELGRRGIVLPIHFGNRNWHPFLEETVRGMAEAGSRRALAVVTSAFGSYSGCRQYREDLARARSALGEAAPEIEVLGLFHDRPGFLEAFADRVREVLAPGAHVIFTAHSIPMSMAATSPYQAQLRLAAERVAASVSAASWELAWQSRSGPPSVPWLEPDILDVLARRASLDATERARPVVIAPLGFVSDHVEVIWDLDHEARARGGELGIAMSRAKTVGTHPRFVAAIADMIEQRLRGAPAFRCAPDCCPPPARRG
jgi:ferrochelatase